MTKELAYTTGIDSAPRNGKLVVVFNHTVPRIYQTFGMFDKNAYGGRGGWFSKTGEALTPKTWSPRLTEFYAAQDRKNKSSRKAAQKSATQAAQKVAA